MFSKDANDEECDATMFDSITKAGFKKILRKIFNQYSIKNSTK
jgi:hypothetical protein